MDTKVFMFIVLIIIVLSTIYFFMLLDIDTKGFEEYMKQTTADSMNRPITDLKNANPINNLPVVTFSTTNESLEEMQKCKDGAIFMSNLDDDADYTDNCYTICGSQGKVVTIEDSDEFYVNNKKLSRGNWCVLNPPVCNMNTGYVVAGINGYVCRPKYPDLFGGPNMDMTIACYDSKNPTQLNKLWDNKNNVLVDPKTVVMSDVDELLPDGSYRFTCKWGEDDRGNLYIDHPGNRFHPLRDPCSDTIYRADYSVHTDFDENNDWFCNCGDFSVTRVKNMDNNDPKSTCSSCALDYNSEKKEAHVPYKCFNVHGTMDLIGKMLPCIEIDREGNLCDVVRLNIAAGYEPQNGDGDAIEPFVPKVNGKDVLNKQLEYSVWYQDQHSNDTT